MIFERVKLKDFRQFAGEQEIRFATDRTRNVTILHGFNGAGKTALLNAFTWVLYQSASPDFEDADRLENEAAFAEIENGERLTTSVELIFTDHNRKYTAKRACVVEKDKHGTRRVVSPGELTLFYTDETGENKKDPGNPNETLQRLLPERLHPFFFFNGERIERLANKEAYGEISSGVKTLLGVEVLDRTIHHVEGELSKRLRREIADHSGDEGQQLKERQEQLEQERQKHQMAVDQAGRNLAALTDEFEKIDERLKAMEGLKTLLAERSEKEKFNHKLKSDTKERREELRQEVSTNGYLWLAGGILASAAEQLDGARQKGQLPAPIRRQFVDDLLSNEECICGRQLREGSSEHQRVEQCRQQTQSDELEAAITTASAELRVLQQRSNGSLTEVRRLQDIRQTLNSDLERVGEELSELSSQISDRDNGEDPGNLERRRREIEEERQAIGLERTREQDAISEIDAKMADVDKALKTLERADAQGQLAQRRLDAVTNVCSALHRIHEMRQEELRDDLSYKLSQVWSGISIKDYHASLDDDFGLQLTKEIHGNSVPVRGASTGEKQVLSLAFVGALGKKASETADESEGESEIFRGGLYPLVIDSAFGSLETDYRRAVAEWIPELAPQVIIMVSESQWRREVEDALLPVMGREWILRLETRKNKTRTLKLRGIDHDYVVASDAGFEKTTIQEVPLG